MCIRDSTTSDPVVPAVGSMDPIPVAGIEETMPALYGFNGDASDQDLTATQTQLTWDRQVVVPSFAVNLKITALAGTGISVARAALFVEGR